MAPGVLGPPFHAGADRRRRGVEDRHAVALDDLPPDVLVGIVGRALEHHAGRSVGERAVDDVGVARDPTDVGCAPVDVALRLQVEDVAMGVGDAGKVAAGGVEDALRLRGRARGVEDVERVLGAHRLRRALRRRGLHRRVEPDVAPVAHLALDPGVADDEDRLQRADPAERRVDLGLDRCGAALAAGPVDGDQGLRPGELHPLAHRLRREAAEDDVVRGADPSAGKHGHHDLGDHRQVDADHVSPADAVVAQRVGEALGIRQQLGVGDVALLPLLAAPVEGDAIAPARLDMAVEAVGRGVQPAVGEPSVEGRVGLVEPLHGLLHPVEQLPRLARPPGLRIGRRLLVDRGIAQKRPLAELGRRLEALDLQQRAQLALQVRVARAQPPSPQPYRVGAYHAY